jgi:hypothetical protein
MYKKLDFIPLPTLKLRPHGKLFSALCEEELSNKSVQK